MKLSKSIFILLFLLTQICTGQEIPKSELIEDFGQTNWEDYIARLDNLFQKLSQKTNSTGYVVIHNKEVSDNRSRFRYEEYTKGHIKARNFDERRIVIIRAEDANNTQIQFWLVPEFAEKPPFVSAKWDSALPPNTKPYIFTTTEWSERGLATPSEYLVLNLFSEYLENNPKARGHFVIRARSKKEFFEEEEKISQILSLKYKVKVSRLRFFYIKENKPLLDYYPDVEVWLVPRNKSN